MGFSTAGLQQVASSRIAEGWQTCRLSKAAHRVNKEGISKIVLEWSEPESGGEVVQFLNCTMPGQGTVSRKDLLMLGKLAELNGIPTSDDNMTEDEFAARLQGAISAMDLKIAWGSGDGTFVNDVALPGTHGEGQDIPDAQAQAEMRPEPPKPATAAAPPPATKKKAW